MFEQKSISEFKLNFLINHLSFSRVKSESLQTWLYHQSFFPSLLHNRKFILNIKAKGKFRAKDPLILLFYFKFTGAAIE
jgi:hypothetical protein